MGKPVESKIIKVGNSNYVIVPVSLMRELNLEEGSTVTIDRKGKSIVIRRKDDER